MTNKRDIQKLTVSDLATIDLKTLTCEEVLQLEPVARRITNKAYSVRKREKLAFLHS